MLKKLFDLYLNASIHVGFAVLSYSKIAVLFLNKNQSNNWWFFVFFSTIAGYNLLKYLTVYFPNPKRFIKQYPVIFWITLLSVVIATSLFFVLGEITKTNFFICSLIFLLYPFGRKNGYLKIFLVAICVTLFIFLPENSILLFKNKGILILMFFLFIITSLIPFEIIDYKTDEGKIDSVIQKLGIEKTKIFGCLLTVFFLITSFFNGKQIGINALVGFCMLMAIWFSKTSKSKYYTSFWVESIPMVWWLLLVA
jgi:hypothetical protein